MREKNLPDKSFWIFALILFLALLFETSVTTLPFIIGAFVLASVLFHKSFIFVAAFITGLIFDILALREAGTTSAFLIFLIFLIFMYENKFEIQTLPFVFISTFLGSISFLIFLNYGNILLQAFLVSSTTSILFRFLSAPRRDKIGR